ncbi:basic amino acid ABC transporter substrate-binding protein [Jiangella alba]|uniref:Amino acid ABC transporter substrate-binding protein, PAAT family n=1 Tax=Jiangella alba TaxID=561176 RepID=A0A1H5PVZ2_9ACTN|nr:amino acid ABC transporter substrate-binding protein, PAAT family [Jiangella alba]
MSRHNSIARLTKITAAAAVVAALAACGGDDDGGSTATGTQGADLALVQDGTLTVCSDVPYPPFEVESPDAPSGYSGFDMDLMQAIADGLGLQMAVQDVGFDPLQSGAVLAAGQCDLGASAMTITDERKQNLDFSDPYYDSLQSLLVPADSGITSIDDLVGKTVGVQQGTTGEIYAKEHLPEGANEPQAFPSDAELWPALQAGNIAAILQDLPVNQEHARSDPGYEVVEEYQTDEQYGFAFAKGEKTALLDAVNEQLQALRDDGTYDEIYAKYFAMDSTGTSGPTAPSPSTS